MAALGALIFMVILTQKALVFLEPLAPYTARFPLNRVFSETQITSPSISPRIIPFNLSKTDNQDFDYCAYRSGRPALRGRLYCSVPLHCREAPTQCQIYELVAYRRYTQTEPVFRHPSHHQAGGGTFGTAPEIPDSSIIACIAAVFR